MRGRCQLTSCATALLMTVAVGSGAVWAAPPSVVLPDGGIQFPDGTLLESAATIDPPDTMTVVVDCGIGETIADALETPARELTVEVNGVCNENVLIRRSDVTLTGSDKTIDKIHGVTTGAEIEPPVVWILDAVNVGLEHLTIESGARNGIIAQASRVDLTDCSIENNSRWGLIGANASEIGAIDVTLSGNPTGAVAATTGTRIILENAELTGNATGSYRYSVLASAASYVYLYDSTITSDRAIQVFMSGFVFGQDTSITAADVALFSAEQGDINWFGFAGTPSISGAIQADWKALIWMENVNQTDAGSGEGNYLSRDSTAYFVDVTLQDFALNTFSNGTVEGLSSLGDITCGAASDLYCDGTTVTSSTCSMCPVPP